AVQEGEHRRLQHLPIAGAERRERNNDVAFVIKPNRQNASLRRVRYAIRPASAFHPGDLDDMSRAECEGIRIDQRAVAYAFQLGVVSDAGGAFAEADLRP